MIYYLPTGLPMFTELNMLFPTLPPIIIVYTI